jgi:hypothetical protein
MTTTWKTAYLGECHVGNYDHIQGRRGILLDAGVTAGVVLVRAGTTSLPGLAVLGLGDGSLGGGAGGGASCAGSA